MSTLALYEDVWAAFRRKIYEACPGATEEVLAPIIKELESTIEQKLRQEADEVLAKVQDKTLKNQRSESIAAAKRWYPTIVRFGTRGESCSEQEAKRLKQIYESSDKHLKIPLGEWGWTEPQLPWESAECDEAIGQVVTYPAVSKYQSTLWVKDQETHFRPKGNNVPSFWKAYKFKNAERTRSEFLALCKLGEFDDFLKMAELAAKFTRQRKALFDLLKLAMETNADTIEVLEQFFKLKLK
jgi:hypothetical protein